MKATPTRVRRVAAAAGSARLAVLAAVLAGIAFSGWLLAAPAKAKTGHSTAASHSQSPDGMISLGGMKIGGGSVQIGGSEGSGGIYVGGGCVRLGGLSAGSCGGRKRNPAENNSSGKSGKPSNPTLPSGGSNTTGGSTLPAGRQQYQDRTGALGGGSTSASAKPAANGASSGSSSPNVYCPKTQEGKKAPAYCYYRQPADHSTKTEKETSSPGTWKKIPYDELKVVLNWCGSHPSWYRNDRTTDQSSAQSSTRTSSSSSPSLATPPGGWAAQCRALWRVVRPKPDTKGGGTRATDTGTSTDNTGGSSGHSTPASSNSPSSSTPTATGSSSSTSDSSSISSARAVRAPGEGGAPPRGGQIQLVCYRTHPMCALRAATPPAGNEK